LHLMLSKNGSVIFTCTIEQTRRWLFASLNVATEFFSITSPENSMTPYRHHVSGFFTNLAPAETTMSALAKLGFSASHMQIYSGDADAPVAPKPLAHSNEVLKDMLVDGAIGTAVGTGLGGLATIALVSANVSLFVASPLLAPLMLLGWGASLGAVAGAVVGASSGSGQPQGQFADLIMAAIKHGDVVLVVETNSQEQTAIAREVIAASVGDFKDLDMLVPIITS
jgi:hypothetical protein